MNEAGGLGDTAQELTARVAQKIRDMRARAIAKVPQLTGAAAQNTQRVVQDKPGAAVGAVLAVVGLLTLRRRQRGRAHDKKAQQPRRRGSRTSRARRWAKVLAVLGFVIRRRRRRRAEG
jgi:MYXO-CTERM domain-containing protein